MQDQKMFHVKKKYLESQDRGTFTLSIDCITQFVKGGIDVDGVFE